MAAHSEKSNTKLQVTHKMGHTQVYEFKPLPFRGDYYEVTIISRLASGNFGTVYLGTSKEFKGGKRVDEIKQVAIKMINISNFTNEERNNLNNEINILHRISNKDICQKYLLCIDYVGYGIETLSSFIYIISEYINGNELSDRIRSPLFSSEDAINAICNLLNAVSILHKMDIVHRDIKLENIMYNRSTQTYKLLDYGLACLIPSCKGWVGTPYTAAPEGFIHEIISDYKKLDIWSTGIILFILISKIYNKYEYFIYYRDFVGDVMDRLKKPRELEGEVVKYLTNLTNEVDSELARKIIPIIMNMVKTNAAERWTIDKVINEIKDICVGF